MADRGFCGKIEYGSVAEWLKAHDSKSCNGATRSEVRIPSLPPFFFARKKPRWGRGDEPRRARGLAQGWCGISAESGCEESLLLGCLEKILDEISELGFCLVVFDEIEVLAGEDFVELLDNMPSALVIGGLAVGIVAVDESRRKLSPFGALLGDVFFVLGKVQQVIDKIHSLASLVKI